MAIPLKTLELPFETGLAQKADDLWRDPGSATAATNLVKTKSRTLRKRPAMRALTLSSSVAGSSTTRNVAGGRRLGSLRGQLLLLGQDPWGDAVFTFDDTLGLNRWVELDRAPEVYLQPYEIVVANGNTNTTVTASSIYECDIAQAGGIEVLIWTDRDYQVGNLAVFALIRDAVQGSLIAPPTRLSAFADASAVPKAIVCGSNIVLAWSDPGADNIYGLVVNTGAPQLNPAAAVRINLAAGDSLQNDTSADAGPGNPYDIAAVVGDTTKCALIYESTVAGPTRHIKLAILNVPALTVSSSANVDGSDSQWTTDNGVSGPASALTGLSLRVDNGLGQACFAYAWRNTTPATRVTFGGFTYPGLLAIASSVFLMGQPGPLTPATDKPAAIVSVSLAQTGDYSCRISPRNATLGFSSTQQLPYIANWQIAVGGGSIAINANFPHVTWNLALYTRDLELPATGLLYFVAYCPSPTQGTFFLFSDDSSADFATTVGGSGQDYYPYRLVGNIAPRLASPLAATLSAPLQSHTAGHLAANPYAPSTPLASTSGVYDALVPVAQDLFTTALAVQRVDFASQLTHRMAEFGQNVVLANGSPSGIDGQGCFELAFPVYPTITNLTFGGAGNLSAGLYSYIAIYYWQDARGQAHVSARSAVATGTAAANQQATVTIATCPYSSKTHTVNLSSSTTGPLQFFAPRRYSLIKLYRTAAGGTQYNNVLPNDGFIAINAQRVGTVTYVDGASDASIASNKLLYGDGQDGTQPGSILDNLSPPAFQDIVAHQNRLFGIDGPRIWSSKAYTTGQGPGFNELTAFSVDDSPGPFVALASFDDKLILFKRDRIYYLTGLGPADNGQDNDWIPPQRIVTDVGALDWRGIVVTPQGCYFQSPAGRRMLTRDLQVVPVPIVEDIDATDPVVTSALIHPTANRIAWTQTVDDQTAPRVGTIVERDYLLEAWTQHNVSDGTRPAVGAVSACVANAVTAAGPPSLLVPTYHTLAADGTVLRETPSASEDIYIAGGPNLFVPFTWTSPWLKSDGIMGWSHWAMVRLTLKLLDPCNLTVKIAYNFGATLVDTYTYTAQQLVGFTTPIIEIEARPNQPREPAMQITLTDTSDPTTVTGAGFLLVGIRVEYGVEPGGQRVPVSQMR